ncbi:GDSL esterase/lipase LTL1-like protein [Drosera capensis]
MRGTMAIELAYVLVFGLVLSSSVAAKGQTRRALFVFGDSLVDSGNNNFLATTARADSPLYGVDYPSHKATGRFSNGHNIPDILKLTGSRLLVGANFASAGIGILNDTGIQFLNIIKITNQMEYFEQYQQQVAQQIGDAATQRLVNQALVLITLGDNDFVNNYYLVPFSARARQYALPDYVHYLISEYQKILERLYQLGARRVLVTGCGPLGCVPAERAERGKNGECAQELQDAASLFNPHLLEMIKVVNGEIGSDVFIAVNAHQMHKDFITNPEDYGFVTSKIACCGQGPFNGIGLCTMLSNLCPNRDQYAFWDAFHPTEKANRIIVDQMMKGSVEYMYPMNLSTLLALDAEKFEREN